MLKWILKKLIPDSQVISEIIADSIQNWINNTDKSDKIAIGASYVAKYDKVQDMVLKWLNDGKIDDDEKKELSSAICPIVERVIREIKK